MGGLRDCCQGPEGAGRGTAHDPEHLRTVDGRISPFPTVLHLFASQSRCTFALGSSFYCR